MRQSDYLGEIVHTETTDSGLIEYILLQGETKMGEDELEYRSSISEGDPSRCTGPLIPFLVFPTLWKCYKEKRGQPNSASHLEGGS